MTYGGTRSHALPPRPAHRIKAGIKRAGELVCAIHACVRVCSMGVLCALCVRVSCVFVRASSVCCGCMRVRGVRVRGIAAHELDGLVVLERVLALLAAPARLRETQS
jgi:hypothetical protein